MLHLNTIRAQIGATHKKKRLGRGSGSGLGPTAGKGDKGQLARSGGSVRPGFEGGQMPLYRRIPKRGFTSMNKKGAILNVVDLEKLEPSDFQEISLETLAKARIVKGRHQHLSVLGTGEITKAFHVKAHKFSTSAQEKIQKAGGKCEVLLIPKMELRVRNKKKA